MCVFFYSFKLLTPDEITMRNLCKGGIIEHGYPNQSGRKTKITERNWIKGELTIWTFKFVPISEVQMLCISLHADQAKAFLILKSFKEEDM